MSVSLPEINRWAVAVLSQKFGAAASVIITDPRRGGSIADVSYPREIGIRKAIGAERKGIITQFLIEAAVLCGIGGILGIVVGCLGTLVLGKITFNTILLPDTGIKITAFAVSLLMGLIFGMYPAAKASGLPPVEAL